MCGISGLLYFDPERGVEPPLLDAMTDVLAHRGPDGRGTHIDGPLGLGHRRLAIIDLSPDAAQPMSNEDGSVWVVLNGEIYNFQGLRDELVAKGHRFRSRSDTEVLVHLYEEEGPRLVERLRGMFAFALWDARARRLLLARDRFGKKPLYYRLDGEAIRFASEIKGILADPTVPREPDLVALDAYLTYCYVPAPMTAFRGIKKLPPGCTLTVEADGREHLHRYWSLSCTPKRPQGRLGNAERARIEEDLRGLLDEAVRLRMISDVPLGAFLSGGVDSSAVVASMCAVTGRPDQVRTFSIGFDEPDYDESAEAARVARHLGTAHTALTLTPDAFAGLEQLVWHYGEPFADASAFPTFAVSQLARKHVTVALSGDGGDELLVGYGRYLGIRLEERIRGSAVSAAVARRRGLIELLRRAGSSRVSGELAMNRALSRRPLSDVYLARLEYLGAGVKEALYGESLGQVLGQHDARDLVRGAIAAADGETFTERCAQADAVTYLPDDILVKVDVASMAYGLEARAPLLDHVLAEYVARLPFRLKMRRLETKVLLKRAMRRRLPTETLHRAKMGFGVPLEHWFRGRLDALLREVLLAPEARARGLFRPEAVERFLAEHSQGQANHRNVLYPLLVAELWHRQWIDPAVPASRPTPVATGA